MTLSQKFMGKGGRHKRTSSALPIKILPLDVRYLVNLRSYLNMIKSNLYGNLSLSGNISGPIIVLCTLDFTERTLITRKSYGEKARIYL
jgi:hypothetical protein